MPKKSKNFPIFKFAVSVIWDFLDFTIFRIPGIGTVTDVISIPLAFALWGPVGVTASWELLDVTDQLDAEVPTLTLIGIYSYFIKE